jgi:hypothetical protein
MGSPTRHDRQLPENFNRKLRRKRAVFCYHLIWLILTLIVSGLALGDTAIVAWYANVLSAVEAVSYGSAFGLISIDALVTFGNFERMS